MEWLPHVSDPKQQVLECLNSEQYRFDVHFNTLLQSAKLPRIWVLNRLKQSRRNKQFDYGKGKESIPCYCFSARKTSEVGALTFFVAFAKEADGSIMMWIQDFHLDPK